jgi:hypothetical protein
MVRFLCVLAVFLFAGGMALRGAKATGLSAVATLGANSLRAPTMPTSLAQVLIIKSIRIFIAALVGHTIPLSEFKRTS